MIRLIKKMGCVFSNYKFEMNNEMITWTRNEHGLVWHHVLAFWIWKFTNLKYLFSFSFWSLATMTCEAVNIWEVENWNDILPSSILLSVFACDDGPLLPSHQNKIKLLIYKLFRDEVSD